MTMTSASRKAVIAALAPATRAFACLILLSALALPASAATLRPVSGSAWSEAHVRRVLDAFAYGGLANEAQVRAWSSSRSPARVVAEILRFDVNNNRLSPAVDANAQHCHSLEALQTFWSSDHPDNRMTYRDRWHYATLSPRQDPGHGSLQRAWTKAINTRGCNPFLFKTALFLSNYHAPVRIERIGAGLTRAYHDDYLVVLSGGGDFIDAMLTSASHAAISRAYGHQYNRTRRDGTAKVNDDFAREYFQRLFRIDGTTENRQYHETVTIENNAKLLTGMDIDKLTGAYGARSSSEWWVAPIDFSDHVDDTGRQVLNVHFHFPDCLEILGQDICGATAYDKLASLGPIAAAHHESMRNVPVALAEWFGDDNLNSSKRAAIHGSWRRADFDLLKFLREYAASREFHAAGTFKFKSSFDRNLAIQNANVLDNEETFARELGDSPHYRMARQGVAVFAPIRGVFGHQTGLDAANNRFLFKKALAVNIESPKYLYDTEDQYTLSADGPQLTWDKDWGAVIPTDRRGRHRVRSVARWLWNRFIGDQGRLLDRLAQAQLHALLATGRDFGYTVDPSNPNVIYSSNDLRRGPPSAVDRAHRVSFIDLSSREGNERVGMAINFITLTPYTFAREGE